MKASLHSRLARLSSHWWNQISLYLPVVLMGMLALISYWVVSRSPAPDEPRPPPAISAEPDYFMRAFAVRTFASDGQLRTEIEGLELRHYPADNTIHVDQARMQSIDETGRLTTAQAQRLVTNDAQTIYALSGDVVIVREAWVLADGQRLPRLEFRGESITYDVEQDQLASDQPVTLMRDQDRMQADKLLYRIDQADVVLQGRVRATLQSRRP